MCQGGLYKTVCAFFASRRYWPDERALQDAAAALQAALPFQTDRCLLIADGEHADELQGGEELLIAVPMSGAVQTQLLSAAERYESVLLYAAYVPGNAPEPLSNAMLEKNAAPSLADCWGVLRRSHPRALLAITKEDASDMLAALDALRFVRGARLLLIGETEPWVVSAPHEPKAFRRLGVTIERVSRQEVRERFETASASDAAPYVSHFRGLACRIEEPDDEDLQKACRMAFAIVETLKAHRADGAAIACFDLLKTGTSSCLGVSYINDCTPWVAACEGELDSAVTMLMLKRLTSTRLWMANCGFHADKTMNFSHCTAPVNLLGEGNLPCILRSHHESGIGVSPQVTLPLGRRVAACRISAVTGQATVQTGITVSGPREPVCRTQAVIRFDDPSAYLNTLLGCHQVFAFEDVSRRMELLCRLMGLSVLTTQKDPIPLSCPTDRS